MRSGPSALQGSGWLGQSACGLLPTPSSTHIFAGLQTYGLLIRPAKTSHTAGTLCAIFSENYCEKTIKKDLKNIK
jgi:hypothetical protein